MKYLFLLSLVALTSVPVFPQDTLCPLPAGSLQIGGFVGNRIDLCLRNRVMAQDVDLLIKPFREKSDGKWGFRNDFWGRWYTSAMLGYSYAPNPEIHAIIDAAVKGLMETQSADGYIGTYPEEFQLGEWDVWGTKRVLAPDMMMSCCLASGPQGLMLTPSWSVMSSSRGVALNLFGNINAKIMTPEGQSASINMESDYPAGGSITATISLPEKEKFTIDIRIPEWSKNTEIRINGKPFKGDIIAGTYASVNRQWSDQDKIELAIDMHARVVKAPSNIGDAAIQRGPVILAFDSRLVPFQTYVEIPPMYRYKFLSNTPDDYIDVDLLEKSDTSKIWMTFNVPLLDEAGSPHFMKMCDYASAGNTWQQDNIFRVWVHQPFDLRHLYINKLNWRVINPFSESDEPPTIPERYKK